VTLPTSNKSQSKKSSQELAFSSTHAHGWKSSGNANLKNAAAEKTALAGFALARLWFNPSPQQRHFIADFREAK
jgi:hypothetical protein